MHKTVLALLDNDYEDLELWYPKIRLEEAGYEVHMAAPEMGTYTGKYGYPADADLTINKVKGINYNGLLIPGGWMPDKLRRDEKVLDLVREFHENKKPIAFICHGGWIPISAKIIKGRKVTGSLGIKDDLINAGGVWVNGPSVIDGNLISARTPRDLAPFCYDFVHLLQRQ